MKANLLRLLMAFMVVVAGLVLYVVRIAKIQGLTPVELDRYQQAHLMQKSDGTFSIEASNWQMLVEGQGYLVASQRMFQMDLMRRKGEGALSELFGDAAVSYDKQQRREDWRGYAKLAINALDPSEKSTCDAYAKGVNEFLNQHGDQAGLEYKIIGLKPDPWSCEDTFLIVLAMADGMSSSWMRDLPMKVWHDTIPGDWWRYLFPIRHPWNKLWFDDNETHTFKETLPTTALPMTHLSSEDFKIKTEYDKRGLNGSNSWAYRGKKGAWLANDPHLGYQIPQLWVPIQLKTIDGWWITGTALPGVPGVLIGMNQHLAWSITNTMEDVDDAVIEDKSAITSNEVRIIKIKDKPPVSIQIQKSPRGPIVMDYDATHVIARQWIALKPGSLTLPVERLNHVTDWTSFNDVLDQFKFVPLNFTMLDHLGNMGLRISGCDIARHGPGAYAVPAAEASWDSDCLTTHRHRLYIASSEGDSAFISTANERLWDDDQFHNFADDDRARRIREYLSASKELSKKDMTTLQLDTTSRFHREFLQWILTTGDASNLPEAQRQRWQQWTGDIHDCPLCMSQADDATLILDQIITEKIAGQFNSLHIELPVISRELKRAKIVRLMESKTGLSLLGLDPQEVANGLIKVLAESPSHNQTPWQIRNIWDVQHPFVHRVPIIGELFKINPYPQFGAPVTVRSEKPMHGPSMRIVWMPSSPNLSTWSFPVGASGHVMSPYYANWLNSWQAGEAMPVPKIP